MQLNILSDTHLEFHRDHGESFLESLDFSGAGAVVLAGDICAGDSISRVARKLCLKWPDVHFLYVLGNHEFYGHTPQQVFERAQQAETKYPNFHWLQTGKILELKGYRFLGDTMWFKPGFDPQLKRSLSDFRYIKEFTPWVYEQQAAWKEFYEANGQPGDIVVTHHLPTVHAIHPMFAGDPFNCFFLNDVEHLIRKNQPRLWVFGHTHHSFHYGVGETELIARPMGYPVETSAAWEPAVVELS